MVQNKAKLSLIKLQWHKGWMDTQLCSFSAFSLLNAQICSF